MAGVGAGADEQGEVVLAGEEELVDGAAVEEAADGIDAGDGDAVDPGFGGAAGAIETKVEDLLQHG
jgi:hypothetical protein